MNFSPDNPFNWDTNADLTLRPLWQFVKDPTVYKCPADTSQALHNGVLYPRIRSYSMNYYLGGVGGNNSFIAGQSWGKYYPLYFKMSDLGSPVNSPGPNQTFVFVDERSDVINWGNFLTSMGGYPTGINEANPALYEWYQNMPASYHDLSACISFADGHVEIHRWKVPGTYPPLAVGFLLGGNGILAAPYSQDVAYMQSVSARPH